MKKLYSILVITLIMIMGNTFNIIAQAPERFTYQGEARDSRGRILDNKSLTIRASILNGPTASTGTVSWRKDLTAKTDCYGLFTLQIGDAPGETAFASINWGTGKYYLNIQILNGKYWLDMGTTQLLSVPYALYAKSAGSAGNETDPVFKASASFGITDTDRANWIAAFGWGDHSKAGYLKSFTETDPVFGLSPAKGITSSLIGNWNLAYSWGDHAGLYRPASWVPSWTEVIGKPFRIDIPRNGDLLMYDQGIERWINWTPDYLTSYSETDPIYSEYFDLTGAASGDLLKFDGTKYVKYTPDFTLSNYSYNSKYGIRLLARNDAQANIDFVISPKGSGAIIAQQPDGTGMSGGVTGGGNERGSNAVDLQTGRILNTQVASGENSVIIGGFGNTASGINSAAMGTYTTASGNKAISLGTFSKALGSYSTAMGSHTQASGEYSIALGAYTTAPSGYETVIGRYNTDYTPASTLSWDNDDRLFVIGNGTHNTIRSNALTILKNANTTIGGSLTINGNGTSYSFPEGRGVSGQFLKTNADGTTVWETPASAGTGVTSITGTAPVVSSGGNTPVISITSATTTTAGSMSADDKTKLDGIAPGAELNVNADWNATSGDAQILNKPVGTAPGQMLYWNGTEWAIVASGLNGQILKYKNGVPTWVDGNINDLSIGDSYQGGIIAYFLVPGDPGYDANVKHGLIAAPNDQSTGIQWYNGSNIITGATGRDLGTGDANTGTIITIQGPGSYAALLCADLESGGYSDWYLPSRHELDKLELNKMAIGGFADSFYWSSSEFSASMAERVDFGYHIPPIALATKNISYPVRAIRAF